MCTRTVSLHQHRLKEGDLSCFFFLNFGKASCFKMVLLWPLRDISLVEKPLWPLHFQLNIGVPIIVPTQRKCGGNWSPFLLEGFQLEVIGELPDCHVLASVNLHFSASYWCIICGAHHKNIITVHEIMA
jgi:hypothetical protein